MAPHSGKESRRVFAMAGTAGHCPAGYRDTAAPVGVLEAISQLSYPAGLEGKRIRSSEITGTSGAWRPVASSR
ncbi:hypothetical protein Y1Q_0002746 [Alligator mississippiensis]|uniref:Uncharacterized protein n=1 Tax=Alligator mississippiensis TaxID=8496 RepID=A0A151NZA0_ALLMI|nr:hypothetical protein Y1Q_0002746 [Alligator mississippiensis]